MVILEPPRSVNDYVIIQTPLPVWNKREVTLVSKIAKGGSANFRIPKTVNPFGGFVVVKDRDKEILRREFRDIPETSA